MDKSIPRRRRGRPRKEQLDFIRTKAWAHCVARHVATIEEYKKDIASTYLLEEKFSGRIDSAAWSRYLRGKRNVSEGTRDLVDRTLNTKLDNIYKIGPSSTINTAFRCNDFYLPLWAAMDRDRDTALNQISFQLFSGEFILPPLYPDKGIINRRLFVPGIDLCSIDNFYDIFFLYTGYSDHISPKDIYQYFPLVLLFSRILVARIRNIKFRHPSPYYKDECSQAVAAELKHYGLTLEDIFSTASHPSWENPRDGLEAVMDDMLGQF